MFNQQIHTFITVAESGSFSKAADNLYITTVSVMKQINSFEKHVGVKLLTRTNHGVKLTEAGKKLYESGKHIISYSENAIENLRKTYKKDLSIRIGSSLLYPANEIVKIWRKVPKSDTNIKINIVSMGDSFTNLISFSNELGKSIDCFATLLDSYHLSSNFNFFELGEKPCYISVPHNHKLARKKHLTWNDLFGEKLMLLKKGNSPMLDKMRKEIESKYPKISIVDVSSFYNAEVFNECVEKGYLLETPSIWENVHPSLVAIPMDWDYKLKFGILYSKKPNKAIKVFIKELQNYLECK